MFDGFFSESQSRIDKLQIAAICALMLLGTAFFYNATAVTETANSAPWYNQIWVRQIFWYVVGLGAATAVCLINYHTLARWALVLYWGNVLLLALVLVVGTVRFGARRWFDLGFFSLQPSEFAKLAFILAQAHFLSRPEEEIFALARWRRWRPRRALFSRHFVCATRLVDNQTRRLSTPKIVSLF